MKPQFLIYRIISVICVILISLVSLMSQDTCDGSSSTSSARTHFGCPDLDEMTAEEVLAMPILYIPVVFHFKAYHDDIVNIDVNFTCDPNDPLVMDDLNDPFDYANPYLYAPTFVYYVMKEMNERMTDQLNEDPLYNQGPDLVYSDTRIRYYLLNGPDWTTLIENPDCSSFNFYGVNDPINGWTSTLSKDAIHIIYLDNGASGNGGQAFPNNNLNLNNIEEKNYCRSLFRGPEFNNTWGTARNLNHEIAHLFELDHTWNCFNLCRKSISHPDNPIDPEQHCCDQCWPDNGNPTGANPLCAASQCIPTEWTFGNTFLMTPQQYLTLTLCEHRLWWSNKTGTPFEFSDFCNSESEVETLIYDTGTKLVWSGQRLINADVIIKNGTELEITCDVFMGDDKKIIVERGARLTVNGGSISSCVILSGEV